jgi:PAS domain S-box-containing protein
MRVAAIGGQDRLLVITRDISERKQAEEARKREEVLSRAIIDSIPDTFYMLDANGRYVRWNAYQRDEIVGRPESQMTDVYAIDTIHPDDRALIASRIGNVLANGVEEAVEGRVLLRGGPAFRWFLMTGRRIIIDGRPFLVGVCVDITERRQAQEQYRGLFEAMLEGFAYCRMLYDAQGHAVDWVYLAANPAFEQLTGLTNPVGKRVTEAISGLISVPSRSASNQVFMSARLETMAPAYAAV